MTTKAEKIFKASLYILVVFFYWHLCFRQSFWMDLPNKKASRIRVLHSGNFEDMSKWEDAFEWLISEAEKFHSVFPKYIRLEE